MQLFANSRFHAYSIPNEYEDSFDSFSQSIEVDSTSSPQGRGRGDGMPSLKLGVGVREDVITLWEELDEARNTLAEIQALLCEIKDPKDTPGTHVHGFSELFCHIYGHHTLGSDGKWGCEMGQAPVCVCIGQNLIPTAELFFFLQKLENRKTVSATYPCFISAHHVP